MPEQISVQDYIRRAAKAQGVPEALALAVAEQESGFNPTAEGPVIAGGPAKGTRAKGTFQIVPSTAAMLGIDDPDDPVKNIDGGVKYLRQLLDQHDGDVDQVLKTYGGVVHDTAYVPAVKSRLQKYLAGPQGPVVAPGGVAGAPDPALARASVLQKLAGTRPVPSHGAAPAASPAPSQPAGAPSQARTPTLGDTASNIGWDLQQGKLLKAGQTAWNFATTGINPMTRTGRENLAGMAGEAAGVMLGPGAKTPGFRQRAMRVLAPAAGAGLGAAAETVAENALTGSEHSPAEAATDQTAYALGGQALMWPVKRLGRIVTGTRVAKEAASTLHQQGKAIADQMTAAQAGAKTAVADLTANLQTRLRQITTAATQASRAVKVAGAGRVAKAEGKTAAALADLDLAAADATVSHTRQLNELLSAGGSTGATADATRAVLDGPAKQALQAAGARVAESAVDGPPIAVRPLQATLLDMLAPARPPSMYPTPEPRQVGFGAPVRAAKAGELVTASTQRVSAKDYQALVNGFAQQSGLPPEHPLPDVLKRFLSIDPDAPAAMGQSSQETIPFAEMHQIKRLLDDTINWDARSKKLLGQITKGFRGKVREALAVHEPYNVATAAYEPMVHLQTKGLGKRLATYLATPGGGDAAARMLKNNNPIAAQTLKDLLVGQATAGGDPAMGQRAWDAARATWAHDNLFSAGIDKLGERLAKLEASSPQFLKIIGSDPTGQQVLANAKRLAQAVEAGQAFEAQTKAFVKGQGKQAVESATAATDTARATIVQQAAAAKAGARATTATAKTAVQQQAAQALAQGTAAQRAQQATRQRLTHDKAALVQPNTMQDVIKVGAAGTAAAYGGYPMLGFAVAPLWRLLRGPQRDAILEWAAYSTPNTQRLVTALERPQNPQAVSLLLRDITTFLQGHLADQQAQTTAGQAAWDQGVAARQGTPAPAP